MKEPATTPRDRKPATNTPATGTALGVTSTQAAPTYPGTVGPTGSTQPDATNPSRPSPTPAVCRLSCCPCVDGRPEPDLGIRWCGLVRKKPIDRTRSTPDRVGCVAMLAGAASPCRFFRLAGELQAEAAWPDRLSVVFATYHNTQRAQSPGDAKAAMCPSRYDAIR